MKKLFIIFFLILINTTSFCQEELSFILDFTPRIWGKISENKFIIEYYDTKTYEIFDRVHIPITREESSGLQFIMFSMDIDLFPEDIQLIKPVLSGDKKWLLLHNQTEKYLSIHEGDGEEPLYWFSLRFTERTLSTSYTSTSHLTENGVEYSAGNLKDNRTGLPWVEGVPGDGVGEKIFLTYDRYPSEGFSHLLLSNGFVSYRNPSLYAKNGRVKRIRVMDSESEFVQEFDIDDTPNYQILELARPLKTITVEILEVYPGSLWDDTCINLLEPVWPQL